MSAARVQPRVVRCEPGETEIVVAVNRFAAFAAFDTEEEYLAFAAGRSGTSRPSRTALWVEQKGPGGAVSALRFQRSALCASEPMVVLVWQEAGADAQPSEADRRLWERFWWVYGGSLAREVSHPKSDPDG